MYLYTRVEERWGWWMHGKNSEMKGGKIREIGQMLIMYSDMGESD